MNPSILNPLWDVQHAWAWWQLTAWIAFPVLLLLACASSLDGLLETWSEDIVRAFRDGARGSAAFIVGALLLQTCVALYIVALLALAGPFALLPLALLGWMVYRQWNQNFQLSFEAWRTQRAERRSAMVGKTAASAR